MNPPTDAELDVVLLYLFSLSVRPVEGEPDALEAVHLHRSWIGEDWATVCNRRPVREHLGFRKVSQTLGRSRFYAAVEALADQADDDLPAVATVRHGASNSNLIRL